MKQNFIGNELTLKNFSSYMLEKNGEFTTLFNNLSLSLSSNKIYKLVAPSGSGKTTFLKAITNNWLYTDGIVTLPAKAENNMCFIPQNSFTPTSGSLLTILTYFLKTQKSVSQSNEITESSQEQIVIQEIKHMLTTIGLMPSVIKEEELEEPNVNWSERLSGGEKQKIRIIQAILSQPTLLIMDEATSALDPVSKQAVYTLIKEHLQRDYIVIYTDHGEDKGFADCSLRIIGQNLVESYELSDSINTF